MKPLKIIHSDVGPESKAQKTKRISKTVLAIFLSLVVVTAAFFAVYAVSRALMGAQGDGKLKAGSTIEMTLASGEGCMLTLPEDVDIMDVTFTSSDERIARVDPAGKVDGLREGKAKITAEAGEFSAACDFTVTAADDSAQPAEVTTAYTANSETLNKNKEKSEEHLYCIVVNRRTNTVTVYTYDDDGNYSVPVRAMVCSCGANGTNATPEGQFKTASKSLWATLYGDATHEFLYGQYVTEFYGDFLFHSVPYVTRQKNNLEPGEFNKLGSNASQGCVRLMVSDCYWIYQNCAPDTPVYVIDQDAEADPLGTPPGVKSNTNGGWDPTDPDKRNPYKGKLPSILKVSAVTVKKGAKFDPMKGVVAKDICGNVITDRVEITGQVLTNKPGVYYLTYSVTDDFHLTRSVIRKVVVK